MDFKKKLIIKLETNNIFFLFVRYCSLSSKHTLITLFGPGLTGSRITPVRGMEVGA